MTTDVPASDPGESHSDEGTKTLREHLDTTAKSPPFTFAEAIALIAPILAELEQRHGDGELLFVHPSAILLNPAGEAVLDLDRASEPSSLPGDRACLAPEQRDGAPGDARASVYSFGALLYELVTGLCVRPGMVRPSERVPELPDGFESILGHALVADPLQRSGDLAALSAALQHLCGRSLSSHPHSEFEEEVDIDVSMSVLPPLPLHIPSPYDAPILDSDPRASREPSAEEKLAELKQSLEKDPRPRYIVVKDGIDHGPFGSVELLQQIASHTFDGSDVLRDSVTGEEQPICDWEAFAPFALHAARLRAYENEQAQIHQVATSEGKQTRHRAILAVATVSIFVGIAAAWLITTRGTRADIATVAAENGVNIETDAGVKAKKRKRRSGAGGKSYPSGLSCSAAMNGYVEEIKIGGPVKADLTEAQLGAVMNGGGPLAGCGVPASMKVRICAAVQNGRARGVTVTTEPPSAAVSSCVDRRVRSLNFPRHHKMDRVTTTYQ